MEAEAVPSLGIASVVRAVSGNQRIMAIFPYPIMQTSFFLIFRDFV